MLDKKSIWINPIVLKSLREKLNLDRKEVENISKKLKKQYFESISTYQLAEWEEGRGEPELLHLETLSEIYHCPVGYFFLDEVPKEKIPISYRGLSQEKKLSYQSNSSLQRFYELANFTVSLIERLNILWKVKIRPCEINQNYKMLDEVIKEKRNFFGWETARENFGNNIEEAFKWWKVKIENLGIFCFELKLEPKEIRGASLWLKSYPFILVNRQNVESSAGRIFTILHEYCHLISEEEGVLCDFRGVTKGLNPETFANKFAAEILLPHEEFKKHLLSLDSFKYRDWWSDKEIDEIRKPFFVSRDVIAIKLQETNLSPHDFYDQKRMKWDKKEIWGRGGSKKLIVRKEQKLREFGHSFTNLIAKHFNHPSFPLLDASYILNMKVEKVNDFIKWINEKG